MGTDAPHTHTHPRTRTHPTHIQAEQGECIYTSVFKYTFGEKKIKLKKGQIHVLCFQKVGSTTVTSKLKQRALPRAGEPERSKRSGSPGRLRGLALQVGLGWSLRCSHAPKQPSGRPAGGRKVLQRDGALGTCAERAKARAGYPQPKSRQEISASRDRNQKGVKKGKHPTAHALSRS